MGKKEYYDFTLLTYSNGFSDLRTTTHWVGFVDNDYDREIRVASIVNPDLSIKLWKGQGQDCMFVHSFEDYMKFMFRGGNALVEKSIAKKYLKEMVEPKEVVKDGEIGYKSASSLDKEAFNRAPTPKLRMRIFKRDKKKCKICGRSPDNHTDVELHIHHIRPWALGGFTEPDNLITLCHTCHNGLEPHVDYELLHLINPIEKERNWKNINSYFERGVQNHRNRMMNLYFRMKSKEEASEKGQILNSNENGNERNIRQ